MNMWVCEDVSMWGAGEREEESGKWEREIKIIAMIIKNQMKVPLGLSRCAVASAYIAPGHTHTMYVLCMYKMIAWMKQWMPHTFIQYVFKNSAKLRVFSSKNRFFGIYQLLGVCNTNPSPLSKQWQNVIGKFDRRNIKHTQHSRTEPSRVEHSTADSWSSETMNFACMWLCVYVCNVILL